MTEYKHFISLGYFCNVAMDLEKIGLRNTSSPFDWCISDIEGVVDAIRNRFDGFMEYENLAQNARIRNHYKDLRYDIEFFHDFSEYTPLREQIKAQQDKYERRIARFYKNISEPTLFFRYISNRKQTNGKSDELIYIEKNLDDIKDLIRSFNPNNEIIFLANREVESKIIKIYHVDKDPNDYVSRSPIYNNRELFPIVQGFRVENQEQNVARYNSKTRSTPPHFVA